MDLHKIAILVLTICVLPGFAKAQDTIGWQRYTAAWVSNTHQYGGKPSALTLLPSSIKKTRSGVRLVIPEKDAFVQYKNGNRYIKLYLINSATDTLFVERADATVTGVSTEVFVDGQWKIFQTRLSSSCGYGRWKMSIQTKHFLYIQLENKTKGLLKVPYRVRLKTPAFEVVSNPTTIYTTPELLRLAGTIPPNMSF